MRPSTPILFLDLCLVVILVGCGPKAEETISPSLNRPDSCQLHTESEHAYSDFSRSIASSGYQAAVAALTFSINRQNLWIAYSRESTRGAGQVVEMRLPDWEVVRSVELDDLSTLYTRFNADATLIASISPIECPTVLGTSCVHARVWDTNSRDLISRLPSLNTKVYDMGLSGDGNWLLVVQGGGLNIFDPTDRTRGLGRTFVGGEIEKIIAGVIDRSGNLVAYGTDRKYIAVEKWDGQMLGSFHAWSLGPFNFEGGTAEADAIPIKLAMSSTNQWLAVQSTDELEIRDLSSIGLPKYSKVSIPHAQNGLLEFSPSGKYLAVAHSQGLSVYTVPDLKVALDKPGLQTTAIAFSPDGCLLAWGDAEGTVHIVNAPKP